MDIMKNKVPFGILSLMVLACGATPVDYQSVEELAVAMADSGFECTGEMEVYEGSLGHQGCQWPPESHPEFPADLIDLMVFASDLDRLRFLGSGIAFGCGALPQEPPTISYAYGPTWAVSSGYGDTPLEVMSEIAGAIGGQANAANCEKLYDSLDFDRPFEEWTASELKEILGER